MGLEASGYGMNMPTWPPRKPSKKSIWSRIKYPLALIAAGSGIAGVAGLIGVHEARFQEYLSAPALVYNVDLEQGSDELLERLAEGEKVSSWIGKRAFDYAVREMNPYIFDDQVNLILPAGVRLRVPDVNRNGKPGE